VKSAGGTTVVVDMMEKDVDVSDSVLVTVVVVIVTVLVDDIVDVEVS
jgi:hypothetical protein